MQPFESAWSIFEKFKFANQVNSIELLRVFGTEQVKAIKTSLNGRGIRELYYLESFDEDLLTWGFKFNVKVHNYSSLDTIMNSLKRRYYSYSEFFHEKFVYCAICMRGSAHHSLFHQFKLLKSCPYHMCELSYNCPICQEQMPYMIWKDKNLIPYMCKCGHSIFENSGKWVSLWTEQLIIKDPLVLEWLNCCSQGRRLYFNEDLVFSRINCFEMALKVLKSETILTEKESVRLLQYSDIQWGWKLNDELYALVIDVFKSFDKHLKRLIIKKHKYCLQTTRKYFYNRHIEKKCEYSFAYMTWRNTLLTADREYWSYSRLKVRPTEFNHMRKFPLQMIHKQLEHFVEYWQMNNETLKDVKSLKLMLSKVTVALLSAYWKVCQEVVIGNRTNNKALNALERESLAKAFSYQEPCVFVNFTTSGINCCNEQRKMKPNLEIFNSSSIALNKLLECCSATSRV
ncbi:hypothetical protein GC093_23705 [Paenibacillus sp. LMG 31456]|uniref:TniQ family protein n=1 Tax=Paenibacillus foliorum TaxID=2654974 RepID=A0A972GT10_9BACL|nr:hypothetical protein [Paenibacillus foliorum]NOU96207.1 hypothetical protein [Paenibacillus foliorum]